MRGKNIGFSCAKHLGMCSGSSEVTRSRYMKIKALMVSVEQEWS